MANFSFGATSTPAQAPAAGSTFGGGFGAPAGGAFSFGTPTAAVSTAGTQPGFFNTPASAAPTMNLGGFGATATTGSGINFGKPLTQAPQTGLGFGLSAAPTLGAPAGQQTQAAGGFDFGKSLSAPSFNSSLGGGGMFAPNTMGLQTSTPTSLQQQQLQPQSIGLGGDLNASKPKEVVGQNENTKVKELQVPQDIVLLVENLKSHIKQQKEISSEIAKTPTRKLFNIQNDIENVKWVLSDISNVVDHNYAALKMLKADTSETHQNVEMAQRTHETPPLLQYENTAPIIYFINLVQKYESELIKLRNQVDVTEKHMRSLINPQKLTAVDLKRGMRQIHESFISLASRVQEVHKKVEEQKEQYLNLRKSVLRDKTDVFEEMENNNNKMKLSQISSGPTPFSLLSGLNVATSQASVNKDSWLPNPNQMSSGFGVARPAFGATDTNNLFGSGTGFGNSGGGLVTDNSAFNLQKPPLGAKRNKH